MLNVNIHMMALVGALCLSGCGDLDEWMAEAEAEQQAADMAKCTSQGFATGTNAMATCLGTIEAKRQAESDRFAAQQAADAKAKAHKNNKKKKNHHSKSSEGTYRGATGYDPATANMTMCSDGKLREDCSFAPLGY